MTTLQNRRILLVDDTPAIHEDFHKILASDAMAIEMDEDEALLFEAPAPVMATRYELESAYQGAEAIDKVRAALLAKLPYAMAFIDIRMPPGLDGIETIERLWWEDPELQVVLCTAFSDYSWTDILARLDVRDRLLILKKPFDAVEVYQLASTLTMKWEMAKQAACKLSGLEQAVEERTRELSAVIDNMPQGLCMFDAQQKLVVSNERYAEIYGLDPEQVTPGTPLRTLFHQRNAIGKTVITDQDYLAEMLAAESASQPWHRVNELADGRSIAISYKPMSNGGSVASHEDITDRRSAEARIEYMAHHDVLTQLPNRVRFREDVDRALSRVGRGDSVAIFCLDIDHFKAVNDTLGHPIGDALLQVASERIKATVRPADSIARLGGDEFAILQVPINQPTDCIALASRLIAAIAEPYELDGHQVVVGVSVGIAIAPGDGNSFDSLLKNADMALYRAKADGRGVYRFFERGMDERMQARRALELDLRKAFALGEFELFYQPIIGLQANKVTGFEALLRWRHPERGLVMPGEFIPLAEEIGLIRPLGTWVLKQACAEAAGWPEDVSVAVNLSPAQFENGAVVLHVISALEESGLPANRLELEITETVLLRDTAKTLSTLKQLREVGTQIAMDDFGTGYSSLAYLRKFPFDKIKIDRSFIRDLQEKPESIAIVRAVTGLGSALKIATTAEGVETMGQLNQLRTEGCTEAQGYLFSEPRPAHEVYALLAKLDAAARIVA
jgi:diguanylate cyclase (GGDEF)-like protein/PAS domain S-box-containing protein